MHAEGLDWLANKECGCLVRSRSTFACPRPWCTCNVLYKQCKWEVYMHACAHPAIRLKSCSYLESTNQTPTMRMAHQKNTIRFPANATPESNRQRSLAAVRNWRGGQPDYWPAIRQRELAWFGLGFGFRGVNIIEHKALYVSSMIFLKENTICLYLPLIDPQRASDAAPYEWINLVD